MVSQRQVLAAAVRVVVFTPVLAVLYLAFSKTKPFAGAVLGDGGVDALVTLAAGTPELAVVVPVAAVAAVLAPYLHTRPGM